MKEKKVAMTDCPDCNGLGVYKTWKCQLSDGEKKIPLEEAEEHVANWESYRSMIRGYVDIEK